MAAASSILNASAATSYGTTSTNITFGTETVAGDFRAGAPTNGFKVPAGVDHVYLSWHVSVNGGNSGGGGFGGITLQLLQNGSVIASGGGDFGNLSGYMADRFGPWPVSTGDEFTLNAIGEYAGSANNNLGSPAFAYFCIEDAATPLGATALSRMEASGTTSLANNTVTEVAFGTEAIAGGFRGTGTPTNGFIIPSGVTRARFIVQASISAINAHASAGFRINEISAGDAFKIIDQRAVFTGSERLVNFTTPPLAVSAGQKFVLKGYQAGGGTETMNDFFGTDYGRCFFQIEDATP